MRWSCVRIAHDPPSIRYKNQPVSFVRAAGFFMPAIFQITQWVNHDAKRNMVTPSTEISFSTALTNSPTSAGE